MSDNGVPLRARTQPQSAHDAMIERARDRSGYVAIPYRVIWDQNLTATDLRVLLTIIAHDWGKESAGCRLSYESIAELSQVSRSALKRTVKKLVGLGYIFPPEAEQMSGRRVSTTIRVTSRAREEKEKLESAPAGSPAAQQLELASNEHGSSEDRSSENGSSENRSSDPSLWVQGVAADDGSKAPGRGSSKSPITTTSKQLSSKNVQQQRSGKQLSSKNVQQQRSGAVRKMETTKIRPSVPREPVSEIHDVARLRMLDGWGCGDSLDTLAMFFGLLAQRDRQLGRQPDPADIRRTFDAVSSTRQVQRAGNPLGMLLSGIERGFLLSAPRRQRQTEYDVAPGAQDALVRYIERALAGAAVDFATIRSLGVSEIEFRALVADARKAESLGAGEEEMPPLLPAPAREPFDDAISVFQSCIQSSCTEATYKLVIANAQYRIEDDLLVVTAGSTFMSDQLRRVMRLAESALSERGLVVRVEP